MYTFINDKFRYPKAAQRVGQEGKVLLQFIVTAEGQLDDLKIVEGISSLIDAEAIWVFQEFGKNVGWVPGRKNRKPVAVQMLMPVAISF